MTPNTAGTEANPPSAARAVRVRQLAAEDVRALTAILVYYLVDAALLAAFAVLDVLPMLVPAAYALTGIVMVGGAAARSRSDSYGPEGRMHGVLVAVAVAMTLMLAVSLAAPQVGLLMLMTLVGVASTAALRLPPKLLLPLGGLAALAATGVLVIRGSELGAPVSTWGQRAVTGLWFLWSLVKAASIQVVGTQLREELARSHEQLADALARVEALATRDELTGLPNRRHVLDLLAAERERLHRTGVGLGIAMLDIDHFKRINDTHGHAAGDAVLRAMAQLLRGTLRGVDHAGRLGGEEFLLLLAGPLDGAGAHRAAERVRESIARHDWSAIAPGLTVTASIGVTLLRAGEEGDEAVRRADELLYACKRDGRDRVAAG